MHRSSSSRRRPALLDRFLASPLLPALAVVGVFLACDAAPPTTPEGHERQVVIKPVTLDGTQIGPLQGVSVHVNGQNVPFSSPQPAQGGFYVNLEPGDHELVVASPGYTTVEATLTVAADAAATYDHFVTMRGPVTVEGSVVNSQTGDGVSGATLRFYRQRDRGDYQSNQFHFSLTTDPDGAYRYEGAATGFFTVEVSGQGYAAAVVRDVELSGSTIALDPIAAVPPPPPGTYRVTLTWGPQPADLDAHLTGPDGAGGRFHVFFGDTAPSGAGATLDHDDTDGGGPETVTFTPTHDGTYRFSVYNYSEQSAAGAQSMWYGQPYVTLYDGDGQAGGWSMAQFPRAYAFPNDPPPATLGNTWRVFEVVKSGSTITVNDGVAGDTFGFVMAAHSGDTTVFLTGGPEGPAPEKLSAGR